MARKPQIAAIRYMRPAAALIGLQEVSTKDLAGVFRYEDFVGGAGPVSQSGVLGHIAWKGIGLSGANHRFQDVPEGVVIGGVGGANQHIGVDVGSGG
jgi:hypothetical protein